MKKLWNIIKIQKISAITLLTVFLVAGCSNSYVSDVTRFHALPIPNSESIEVVSLNPNLQKSLEFGQYAEIVGQYLGKQGYQPPQNKNSDYIAHIAYYSRPFEGAIVSEPRSSVGIGVGGGSRHTSVGVGLSIPIGESKVKQQYIHIFTLDIIRRSDGTKLYEGQASSRGKETLPESMPFLIDALFDQFPGESGTSNRVKVSP